MTNWVKQSTAVVVSFGPFVDKTDGVTLETGLVSALDHASTGIFLSKNGGALTIRHATVTATTYDAYGMYRVTLDTTDTNTLGTLRMAFSEAATCLPVWQDFMVVPANVWDSMFGADYLQIDLTQIAGAAVSTSTAQLGVNAVQAGGTAWGSGAITAASIASDAITAAKIATGAIDADAIADNAIDAGALAADAGTEIGTAVWATAARTLTAATNVTSTGAAVPITAGGLVSADVTAISTDTTAADNAELMFDGTGYAGGTTKLAVNAVALSGSTTAADNAEAGYTGIITGTAITGTLSTTAFTTNLTEATDDHYNGRMVTFTSGVLAGQMREITDYNGTTKAITVAAMTDAPSNTDAFFIA